MIWKTWKLTILNLEEAALWNNLKHSAFILVEKEVLQAWYLTEAIAPGLCLGALSKV